MKNACCPCTATALMRGNELAPRLRGIVRFFGTRCGTRVIAHIHGLPQSDTGFFAIHIHTEGCCNPPDFSCANGHYNPTGTSHPIHSGDLPMLIATDTADAYLSFVTTRFRVRDVIGRSVIIHGSRDDYTSQPGGDAGPRIGCGVIRAI